MRSVYSSEWLHKLEERGYIGLISAGESLDRRANEGSIVGYIGFDATADSLHVGSLLQLMLLRHLQLSGHRPLVLLGGGTTLVGDPSGKDKTRQLLSKEQIDHNIKKIRKQCEKFLSFEGENGALLLNNSEWLERLSYIEFLRDIGRHFSVNRMISFDSVRIRLEREQSLSFLEFNYMLLQSYDFHELYKRHGCILQMGGSDQWGNIVSGIELVRRTCGVQAYGLTSELLTLSTGEKMGKTVKGALWLDKEKTSVYDYWQYWRNVDDRDVERFLLLFTEIDTGEISRIGKLVGSKEINEGKELLATEVAKLTHGEEETQRVLAASRGVFAESAPQDPKTLMEELPRYELSYKQLESGVGLLEVLVELGLCSSKGEGRRLIEQGGVRLGDEVIRDKSYVVEKTSISSGQLLVAVGKKRHGLIMIMV